MTESPLVWMRSPRDDLRFRQLKIYYEETTGRELNPDFLTDLALKTVENRTFAKITPRKRLERRMIDPTAWCSQRRTLGGVGS